MNHEPGATCEQVARNHLWILEKSYRKRTRARNPEIRGDIVAEDIVSVAEPTKQK